MKRLPSSLSGRLILAGILFTVVALGVTFVVMERVLERFVTGQIDQRLDNKLVELGSQIEVTADGVISIKGDADGPPFDKPHHRSFWLVSGPRNILESRWLTAGAFTPPTRTQIEAMPGPPPPPPDEADAQRPKPRTLRMVGPQEEAIHVRAVVRMYGAVPVIILAAAPVRAILDPMFEAATTLMTATVLLGATFLVAGLLLTRVVLRPLTRLRGEIEDIRIGRRMTLSVQHPSEVRPLVEALNALLAQNAANLERARKHVANLAHGLKTPLATLSLGIDRLDGDAAPRLQALVTAIERRVRHHLGRARAAALDGPVRVQTPLSSRLGDIVDALKKIHADRRLVVRVDCQVGLAVACEAHDLDEVLGNLLDNAFKYTRRLVSCSATEVGPQIVIEISDDGPGLSAEEIVRVLRPGQRLDEEIPGFGFGLPIARELVELYGGELTLEAADRGLTVTVKLPKAA